MQTDWGKGGGRQRLRGKASMGRQGIKGRLTGSSAAKRERHSAKDFLL